MRQRTGSIIERKRKVRDKKTGELKERIFIYARVTFSTPDHKRHALWRAAANRTAARDKIKELIADLDSNGVEQAVNRCRTFRELCDWFEPKYLRAATYQQGRKVSGLRSTAGLKSRFQTLRAYFGAAELRHITYTDLEQFKLRRLQTPVERRNQAGVVTHRHERTISTVNHELALLRMLLKVATREGWLLRSPFERGPVLISKADETKRERVLALAEETDLLAACTDQRAHLRAIIICAIDTGMRRGEIIKLRWRDVDFASQTIHIAQMNTKTLKARNVRLTPRLAAELRRRAAEYLSEPGARVFGITTDFSHAWQQARAAAGLADLHFHDLRHTAATRMAEGGLSDALIARVLGHSQVRTTFTYINTTPATLDAAARALEKYQEQAAAEGVPEASEAIN